MHSWWAFLMVVVTASLLLANNSSHGFVPIRERIQPQPGTRVFVTSYTEQPPREEQQQQQQQQQRQQNDNSITTTTTTTTTRMIPRNDNERRRFLGTVTRTGIVIATTFSFSLFFPEIAGAAMKSNQTVFAVGKDLTPDEARTRFVEGQVSLRYLYDHYEEICEGGGDNVRRYLGTVGTSSGLYGIAKVMKILQNDADDIVAYTETMNEVNAALVGADGSAYMAIFTESSTSGVPPKKYFDDAKIEVQRAMVSMQEIAKQLDMR